MTDVTEDRFPVLTLRRHLSNSHSMRATAELQNLTPDQLKRIHDIFHENDMVRSHD